MKRLMIIVLLASGALATDFSNMSTEEMMNMRGSLSVDDRPRFRQEMQKRMQSMTPQERQKYNGMGKGRDCMNNLPTFAQYDLNSDGKITKNELEEAREKRIHQKTKEGKMLRNAGNAPAFTDMDKNKDGSLNQEEFRLHQANQIKKWDKRNCPSVGMGKGQGMMRNSGNAPTFADIDTNKDGVISQKEFRLHQTQRMRKK